MADLRKYQKEFAEGQAAEEVDGENPYDEAADPERYDAWQQGFDSAREFRAGLGGLL